MEIIIKEIRNTLAKTRKQLSEYFAGKRKSFSLPIAIDKLPATAFQRRVWKAMTKIPYGRTVTYKKLAQMAGSPNASRAVGNACGKNPLPIIIPCHRVVASNGIGGFSGGINTKKQLLRLENIKI